MSIEEKFNQAKGSVKEGFGKLTGDTKTQAEGAAEKEIGNPQKGAGAAIYGKSAGFSQWAALDLKCRAANCFRLYFASG